MRFFQKYPPPLFVIGLFFTAGVVTVLAAWVPPVAAPAAGNTPRPVDVGTVGDAVKTGNFAAGSSAAAWSPTGSFTGGSGVALYSNWGTIFMVAPGNEGNAVLYLDPAAKKFIVKSAKGSDTGYLNLGPSGALVLPKVKAADAPAIHRSIIYDTDDRVIKYYDRKDREGDWHVGWFSIGDRFWTNTGYLTDLTYSAGNVTVGEDIPAVTTYTYHKLAILEQSGRAPIRGALTACGTTDTLADIDCPSVTTAQIASMTPGLSRFDEYLTCTDVNYGRKTAQSGQGGWYGGNVCFKKVCSGPQVPYEVLYNNSGDVADGRSYRYKCFVTSEWANGKKEDVKEPSVNYRQHSVSEVVSTAPLSGSEYALTSSVTDLKGEKEVQVSEVMTARSYQLRSGIPIFPAGTWCGLQMDGTSANYACGGISPKDGCPAGYTASGPFGKDIGWDNDGRTCYRQ